MIYNAMTVANYIINKSYMEDNPVSNLQLQKMLYFAWVDYFKRTGKSLFWDNICAWQFGPVVPEVYYEYCAYGGRPINIRCETEITEPDMAILDEIVQHYLLIPVNVLVDMTHQANTAWDIIYQNGEGNRQVIPFDLIKKTECKDTYVSK